MRLSGPQLAALARGAGLPEGEVTTAVAVAYAENREALDAAKTIPSDLQGDLHLQSSKWGPSVGPWQIRSLRPAYLAKATGADKYRDAAKLATPSYNATAMRAIWAERGGTWGAWSTYPALSTLYLPTARAAVAGAPAAAGSSQQAAAGGASAQQVGFLGDAGSFVGDAARAVVLPLNIFDDVGDMLGAAKSGLGLAARLIEFLAKAAKWMADPHNWMRVAKVWAGSWLSVLGALMFGWPALKPAAEVAANFIPAGKVAKAAAGAKTASGAAKAATSSAAPAAAAKAPRTDGWDALSAASARTRAKGAAA